VHVVALTWWRSHQLRRQDQLELLGQLVDLGLNGDDVERRLGECS
jgi:hypothetical protein